MFEWNYDNDVKEKKTSKGETGQREYSYQYNTTKQCDEWHKRSQRLVFQNGYVNHGTQYIFQKRKKWANLKVWFDRRFEVQSSCYSMMPERSGEKHHDGHYHLYLLQTDNSPPSSTTTIASTFKKRDTMGPTTMASVSFSVEIYWFCKSCRSSTYFFSINQSINPTTTKFLNKKTSKLSFQNLMK